MFVRVLDFNLEYSKCVFLQNYFLKESQSLSYLDLSGIPKGLYKAQLLLNSLMCPLGLKFLFLFSFCVYALIVVFYFLQ